MRVWSNPILSTYWIMHNVAIKQVLLVFISTYCTNSNHPEQRQQTRKTRGYKSGSGAKHRKDRCDTLIPTFRYQIRPPVLRPSSPEEFFMELSPNVIILFMRSNFMKKIVNCRSKLYNRQRLSPWRFSFFYIQGVSYYY